MNLNIARSVKAVYLGMANKPNSYLILL